MATILCVDDSPKTLLLLGTVFELCGYRVLTARDPDTALRVAALDRFDLAILDYQLPNWTGTSLAKAIKRLNPEVPIMLFSGASPLAKDELNEVDEFVAKGESVDLMLHKVRSLLRYSTASALRSRVSEHRHTKELDRQTSKSGQRAGDVERQAVNEEQSATAV